MEIHASTPEILWTLVALAGVVLRARLLRDALEDRRASVVFEADPALAVIVAGRVRGEVTGLLIKSGFVVIGVYAMTRPNPPSGAGQVIVAAVLIAAVAMLDWNSWMSDRERKQLSRYMDDHGAS
jgi:hypothetical protein